MQKVWLYNTASRKKEEFKPITEGKVGIYSCGPTVYSSPHIGNMEAYIVWDVLVRMLQYVGYEVKQVINVTDVGHLVNDSDDGEDKMEKGTRLTGMSAWDLAKKYEAEFIENLDKLNIKRPWKMPRATENIEGPEGQIELIKLIEKNGFTYKTSDGVYFDTSKFPSYGDFAHLDVEKIKEGARVEKNNEKKNPTDFALWKFSPKDQKRQMEWDSPWGVGFPGWHIECTAMSTKYLGNPFDIHTGGEDHIAIHHTNEIAQAFGAFGRQTANIWMHNAFITFKGEKISKSTGGLYTVFDLEKMDHNYPMFFRYMVLNSHYRKGLEFSFASLISAGVALNRLKNYVLDFKNMGGVAVDVDDGYINEFKEKISNDLAMPEAMAVVWSLMKSNLPDATKIGTLFDFDRVLGLGLKDLTALAIEIPQEITLLANARLKAKNDKNWVEADRLRDEIKQKGYIIEDIAEGYRVKQIK